MASRFNNIDLSSLDPPEILETLEFEEIYQRRLAEFRARYPIAEFESDPIIALLQNASFLETLLRARINDSLKAVFLATSYGTNLDNLGAFYGAERFVLVEADPEADPPVEEVLEGDEAYRRRIQLALEAQSTAGPRGAYLYWSLAADPRVYDANVDSTTPGQVDVAILTADGEAIGELPGIVLASLSDEDVRPLTDSISVVHADVTDFTIEADITFLSGPDRALVMATAQAAAEAYVAEQFRLGRDITLSGIYAALHQPGVHNVDLSEPAVLDGVASINVTAGGSGYTVGGTTVTVAGATSGQGAVLVPIVNAGAIEGISIEEAGYGYDEPLTVTITGDGTGATATGAVGRALSDIIMGWNEVARCTDIILTDAGTDA